jgi:hypothetical protein
MIDSRWDDFSIGMRMKRVANAHKMLAQLTVIVDFTVENDAITPIR